MKTILDIFKTPEKFNTPRELLEHYLNREPSLVVYVDKLLRIAKAAKAQDEHQLLNGGDYNLQLAQRVRMALVDLADSEASK